MPSSKELLWRFGVDTSDFKKALNDITKALEAMAQKQVDSASKATKAVDSYAESVKKVLSEGLKPVSAELLTQQKTIDSMSKSYGSMLATVQKNLTKNKSLWDSGTHTHQLAASGAGEAQSALISGLRQVSQSALGGGAVTAGLIGGLTGGGTVALIEGATHALSEFVGEIHNLVEESDKLINIQNVFDKLSEGIGTAPAEFLNELKDATHGLVTETSLMGQANSLMLQGLPITSDQISKLIGTISKLSIMQGHDLTESFNMVSRALQTGRLSYLAYRLDLDATTRRQLQMAASLPESTRLMTEYEIVLASAQRQLEKMPDHVDTLGTKVKQAGTAFEDWKEKIAVAFAGSEGADDLGKAIDKLSESMKKDEDPLNTYVGLMSDLASSLSIIVGLYTKWAEVMPKVGIGKLDLLIPGLNLEKNLAEIIKKSVEGGPPPVSNSTLKNALKGINVFTSNNAIANAHEKLEEGIQKPKFRFFDEEIKMAESNAKVKEALADEELKDTKVSLDKTKELYDEFYANGLISLNNYTETTGQIKQKETNAEIRKVREQTKARLETVGLQLQKLTSPVAVGGLNQPPDSSAVKEIVNQQNAILIQARAQIAELEGKADVDKLKETQKVVKDQSAAEKVGVEARLSVQKAGFATEKELLDARYKHNLETTKAYIAQQKQIIHDEMAAELQAENEKYDKSGDRGAKAEADHQKAIQDIKRAAQSKNEKLDIDGADMEDQKNQEAFDKSKAVLEARLALASEGGSKAPGSLGPSTEEIDIIGQLIAATQARIVADQQELLTLQAQDSKYQEIQKRIFDSKKAIMDWNQELVKMRDLMTPIGNFFERTFSPLAKATAAMSGSDRGPTKWLEGLVSSGQSLSSIGSAISNVVSRQQVRTALYGGVANIFENNPLGSAPLPLISTESSSGGGGFGGGGILGSAEILGSLKELVHPSKDGDKNNNVVMKTTTERLKDFSDALEKGVASISGWIQTLSGQQGAVGGAVSGSAQGLGLGGGIASTIGATAGGPLSMALGFGMAAVGGVVGAISGKAKKEAQRIANEIAEQFGIVIHKVQVGQTDLAAGIAQAQGLKQQAISELSGRKGGQDQLDKILPQLNQQIEQLQAQQAQILSQFNEQNQLLQTGGVYWQGYLNNVEQLIQKYQQYVAAGGDVANANQFLAESFNQLVEQNTSQLITDQLGAVQNAIQVFDLQMQQQQLVIEGQQQALQNQSLVIQAEQNQYNQQQLDVQKLQSAAQFNQQIQDIMAQGNLTAQLPTAMTKGLKLAVLEQQHQLQQEQFKIQQQQLDQQNAQLEIQKEQTTLAAENLQQQQQNLAEQMAVSTYQLGVEQKIFGLATTRIGLESQLALLQQQQVDQNVDQVQALIQFIGTLQQGIGGIVGNYGGTTEQQIEQIVQNFINQMGLGGLFNPTIGPGVSLPITSSSNSVPGVSSPLPLAGLAPISFPIMGFDSGGSVLKDQLAMVHKGETILPAQVDVSSHLNARLAAESQIVSLANQRLMVEKQILQVKQAELAARNDSGGSGSGNEGLFNIYNTRGRQGLGGFAGELA